MTYISSFKDQNWLIPQSIQDMIPKDHICYFVEEFIDSLDFSKFDMISEGVGHPSYHPRIVMKIIIQGMISKERSSRKLAGACRENFVFMYLAEKVQPEFNTICRFRRNNKEFVKEAFRDTIKLADQNGLVDLNLICTDGSKIKANSGKKMCIKREQVEQLDSIIDKMIEEDIKQDEIDKEVFGEKEENLTNIDLKNLKEIVKAYRKNKNKEKLKEKCKKAKEECEKNPEMKRVSLSDPESRMMIHNEGFYKLSYSAQFTVDSKKQIILANDVCQDREDCNQLKPQIEGAKENIELKEDTKVLADCGYSSGKNYKFLEDEKLDGYIPNRTQTQEMTGRDKNQKQDDYDYDWERDEIIVKGVRMYYLNSHFNKKGDKYHVYRSWEDDKICKYVPEFFWERLRMRDKMGNEKAKKIYALRKSIVEPAIGNIKENLGLREFKLRGLERVKIELNLACIVHNLKKIWLAREESIIQ